MCVCDADGKVDDGQQQQQQELQQVDNANKSGINVEQLATLTHGAGKRIMGIKLNNPKN